MTTIKERIVARLAELDATIAQLESWRDEIAEQMRALPDPPGDSYSYPLWNRRLTALEQQGEGIEYRLDDLRRRRDALLASPLLADSGVDKKEGQRP